MANVVNTTVSPLVANPNYLPDGSVTTPFPTPTVAAAGTTQLTASAISSKVTIVSGSSGTNGVILPVPSAGQVLQLISSAATNAMLVYPPVGGSISFAAVNTALSVPARKGVDFIALDATGNYMAVVSA